MYKFKDEKTLEGMYFLKAKCDGQIVRMFACVNLRECLEKVEEYKREGFIVSWAYKPVKVI